MTGRTTSDAMPSILLEEANMTREQVAGFMLGIGVGTAVGFYLRPPEREELKLKTVEAREHPDDTPQRRTLEPSLAPSARSSSLESRLANRG